MKQFNNIFLINKLTYHSGVITNSPIPELISAISKNFLFFQFLVFYLFQNFFKIDFLSRVATFLLSALFSPVTHFSSEWVIPARPFFFQRENVEKRIEAVFGARIVEKRHQTIRLDAKKTRCRWSARMGSRSVSLRRKSDFLSVLTRFGKVTNLFSS